MRSDFIKSPRQTHYPYNTLADGKLMQKSINSIDFSLRVKEARIFLKQCFLVNFNKLKKSLYETYKIKEKRSSSCQFQKV